MNLLNKKFLDLSTNDVVTVLKINEDVAILDTMERVSTGKLMDGRFYEEQIDPKTFGQQAWGSLLSSFQEKISTIPKNVIDNMSDEVVQSYYEPDNLFSTNSQNNANNEVAGMRVNEEDELEYQKRLMAEKYKNVTQIPTPSASSQQLELLKDMGDDDDLIKVNTQMNVHPDFLATTEIERNPAAKPQPPVQQNIQTQPVYQQPSQPSQPQSNKIHEIFDNVKRNKQFNVSIDYQNNIPRLDFIEMMEDSYDVSIIDYLAEKFTNEILANPSLIKDKIKNAIHTQVYGEPKKEKKVEKTAVVKSTKTRKTKAAVSKNDMIKRKYTKKIKTEVKNDSNNTVSETEVNENK